MDLVIMLGITGGFMLLLGVCGVVADYVFPHIKRLEEYISNLPLMQEKEEDT